MVNSGMSDKQEIFTTLTEAKRLISSEGESTIRYVSIVLWGTGQLRLKLEYWYADWYSLWEQNKIICGTGLLYVITGAIEQASKLCLTAVPMERSDYLRWRR